VSVSASGDEKFANAIAAQYAIERELGRGAAATVFLAYDRKHDRRVAVKLLHTELSAALGADRFVSEIRLLARLQHPHILPLFDSGEIDGALYYVMPYVEGESLRDRIAREGPLPVSDALRIVRQVAEALDHAHARNIVHRDVKPENILLSGGYALVADFGIARAISRAADARTTAAGVAVGTPAYMSPEQATGERHIDGRSDVYSLGVVLYEMLTGRPPFTGPTPQATMAQRFTTTPTRVRAVRPTVPAHVEAAVNKALSMIPADRFSTAAELAAALPEGGGLLPRRWRFFAAGALALVAGTGIYTARDRLAAAPALDRSLYVVLPFAHRDGSAATLMTGDQCERLLYDAFSRWSGLRLVNGMRVSDARLRRGDATPHTLDEAVTVARSLGAGTLAWGEVREFNGKLHVYGALYDVAAGDMLREHQVPIATDLGDVDARFDELADSLLVGGARTRLGAGGAMGTRSWDAWLAYDRGHEALARWDLAGAVRELRAAVAEDPEYAQAQLWLAQALAWASDTSDEWRASAARAAASRQHLTAHDAGLANAMAALAAGRHPEACARYEELLVRDSTDFAAWYGLGDCHAQDQLVMRDPGSASGWRFRGSYQAAVRAYERALQLVPSVHLAYRGAAYSRLSDLLFTESNVFRTGFVVDSAGDSLRFAAFPSLDHDTLAFVPFPQNDVLAARPGTNPPTAPAAVARNQALLRAVATVWVRAFPNSPDAHESLAKALETMGEIGGTADGSAIEHVRQARARVTAPEQAVRLAVAEVRLNLKLGEFGAARRLADSLLAAPAPAPAIAEQIAGLAALTGRAARLVQLMRLTARDYADLPAERPRGPTPLPLVETALALRGYAALGVPAESIAALSGRVARQIESYVERPLRARARETLLGVASELAFPTLGRNTMPDAPGSYLRGMQRALARGDSAAVRARFAQLRELRGTLRPGDLSIDATYQEAWLLLALGDTTAATRLLDLSLDALPTLGTYLLDQVPQAAGLPRAMALRADVAAHRGDADTARRWARAVTALWSGGDEVRPVVGRMLAIAQ
jgi:tRNA A-37 threonylcarbamoyl transferase component Bud32/tetratricopeptide (TPR) repeat protein